MTELQAIELHHYASSLCTAFPPLKKILKGGAAVHRLSPYGQESITAAMSVVSKKIFNCIDPLTRPPCHVVENQELITLTKITQRSAI